MRYSLSLTLILMLACGTFLLNIQVESSALKLVDGTIQCVDTEGGKELSLGPCLSFGLVSIGDEQADVVEMLGHPDQLVSGIDTAQIGIYPLTPRKAGDDPYLLVTISDGVVTTLVLQGRGANEDFSFSGIHLGDTVSVITERLGGPTAVIPHEGYGSELWSYAGYPLSFEIENDRILSIQIWIDSEDK